MDHEQRLVAVLDRLGVDLPEPPAPVASYVRAAEAGGLMHVSGQLPIVDGKLKATGSVPGEVPLDVAAACAERCALNAVAVLRAELGSLNRVERVVRLGVFVASGAGFGDHPVVGNGASELMAEVFGEAGRHARAAVGCSSLPLNAPVEVEVLVAVSG